MRGVLALADDSGPEASPLKESAKCQKLQKAGLDVIMHGKLEARLAKDPGHDPYCRCSGGVAAVVPERLLLARHRRLVPVGKVSNRALVHWLHW